MIDDQTRQKIGCTSLALLACTGLAFSIVLILLILERVEWAGLLSAVAHVLLALIVYLWHGGNQVTPLGMFSFGSAVFMGAPYFLTEMVLGERVLPMASVYAFLAYVGVALVSVVLSRASVTRGQGRAFRELILDFRVDTATMFVLALGLVYGIYSTPYGLGAPLRQGFFYFGAVYFSVAAVASAERGARAVAAIWLAGASSIVVLFYVTQFVGFGRLNVVSLLFCVLVVFALAARTRLVKLAPLVFSPLVVVWAGVVRGPGGSVFSMDSLGSAVAPLATFSNILELFQHRIPPTLDGATYLYPLYFWVPRLWWPGKPEGIGSAYVRWLQPDLAGTGHSVAVSYLGEGLANFAAPGILFAAAYIVLLLTVLNRLHSVLEKRTHGTLMTYYAFIAVVVVQTSVLDFIWADSNTWSQRGLTRILVVLMIALIGGLASLVTRKPPRRESRLATDDRAECQW